MQSSCCHLVNDINTDDEVFKRPSRPIDLNCCKRQSRPSFRSFSSHRGPRQLPADPVAPPERRRSSSSSRLYHHDDDDSMTSPVFPYPPPPAPSVEPLRQRRAMTPNSLQSASKTRTPSTRRRRKPIDYPASTSNTPDCQPRSVIIILLSVFLSLVSTFSFILHSEQINVSIHRNEKFPLKLFTKKKGGRV